MKKRIHIAILSIVASIMFSAGLMAQEQTEVTIQIKEDGKVVQDTTYQFDDADEARHAVKMMEVLSGHNEGMEHVTYNYTSAHPGSSHSKAMVFISEDGETTKIEEFHGDSLVWVSEEEMEGDHVKVMKYKMKEGERPHNEHVIVMKGEDGNTFDILVEEDREEGDIVREKQIKVIVSSDEEGTWNVVTSDEEIHEAHKNVYILKDEDGEIEIEKIIEEHGEGENVKVIVITTDEDGDIDVDVDQDVDVEVKVIKKKQKVKKK